MAIKVKKGGVYADPVGIFAKKAGVYSAVTGVSAKVAGAYVAVSSSLITLPYDAVLLVTGDSQSNGTADDQAAYVASYTVSPRVKIRNAAGAWVTYTPGTSGSSGLEFGANGTGAGPEIGFIERFLATYANDLYIHKDSASGSFQTRGSTIGGALNITAGAASNTYTLNSGALAGNNTLITGTGIEVGCYIPFGGFLANVGVSGGRSTGGAFGPVAVTQYNGTLSWSSTEGLQYNGNSAAINNGMRARLAASLASLTTPQIIAHMHVLGSNDKGYAGGTGFEADSTAFITRIRSDFAMSTTPIIQPRVNNSGVQATAVRTAQANLRAGTARFGLVNMDAQALSADSLHWRGAALRNIGAASFDFTYSIANALLL